MSLKWYPTASGRRVILEQFLLERFSLGVLEGRPEMIRKRKLEELPQRIRSRLPGRAGQLILTPPPAKEVEVPDWVLAAALHSFDPVHAHTDAHCSSLVVVWFTLDVPSDLSTMLREILSRVEWEAHAVDGWY
jgi:hypothetical protein